jgi:hypothetical protein
VNTAPYDVAAKGFTGAAVHGQATLQISCAIWNGGSMPPPQFEPTVTVALPEACKRGDESSPACPELSVAPTEYTVVEVGQTCGPRGPRLPGSRPASPSRSKSLWALQN